MAKRTPRLRQSSLRRSSLRSSGRSLQSIQRGVQTQTNVNKYAQDLINSTSNINDIDINTIYNSNLNNIPESYRSSFYQTLTQTANKLKTEQTNKINSLNDAISTATKNKAIVEQQLKDNWTANARARYSYYLEQLGQLNILKKDLEQGNRYDESSKGLIDYTKSVALPEYQKTLKSMTRVTSKTQNKTISNYINKNIENNTLKSIEQIKKDLKVTDKEAQKYYNLIKNNLKPIITEKVTKVSITTEEKRQLKLLNEFSLNEGLGLIEDYSNLKLGSRFIEALAKKGDVTAIKYKKYQKLSPEDKKLINDYNLVIALKKNFKISDGKTLIIEQQKIKDIKPLLKNVKSSSQVIALLNKGLKKEFKLNDFAKIITLNKLTNSQIKYGLVKGNSIIINKINNAFKSYSDYIKYKKQFETLGTINVLNLVKKEKIGSLNNMYALSRQLNSVQGLKFLIKNPKEYFKTLASRYSKVPSTVKDVQLLAIQSDITKRLKSDENLTIKDYKEYDRQVKRLISITKILKATGNELKQDGLFLLSIASAILIKLPYKYGATIGTLYRFIKKCF